MLLTILVQIIFDQVINFNSTITFLSTIRVDRIICHSSFNSSHYLSFSIIVINGCAHSTLCSWRLLLLFKTSTTAGIHITIGWHVDIGNSQLFLIELVQNGDSSWVRYVVRLETAIVSGFLLYIIVKGFSFFDFSFWWFSRTHWFWNDYFNAVVAEKEVVFSIRVPRFSLYCCPWN